MNNVQMNYLEAKKVYDAAVQAQDWEKVEKVEDAYLDAESALVKWFITVAEKLKSYPKADLELVKKHWAAMPNMIAKVTTLAMQIDENNL